MWLYVGLSIGIKIAKAGASINSTDIRDYSLHSAINTLKIFMEGKKTLSVASGQEEEEDAPAPKAKPKAPAKAKPKPEPEPEEEEEEEEQPAPEDTRPKRRNILKDLDDID